MTKLSELPESILQLKHTGAKSFSELGGRWVYRIQDTGLRGWGLKGFKDLKGFEGFVFQGSGLKECTLQGLGAAESPLWLPRNPTPFLDLHIQNMAGWAWALKRSLIRFTLSKPKPFHLQCRIPSLVDPA